MASPSSSDASKRSETPAFFGEGRTSEPLCFACLANVDASLARRGDGKGVHGDLQTCRLLHISMTCKSLHVKASCKILHEAFTLTLDL